MTATHTVLWAAGMKTTPLADRLAQATGAGQDRQGRFFVDAHLNPEAHPEIYVIGDMAHHEQDVTLHCPVAMPLSAISNICASVVGSPG